VALSSAAPTVRFQVDGLGYGDCLGFKCYYDDEQPGPMVTLGGYTGTTTELSYLGLGARYGSGGQFKPLAVAPVIIRNYNGYISIYSDTGKSYGGANYTPTFRLGISTAGLVTTAGDLQVSGNNIQDSGGAAAITFDGSQNTQFNGQGSQVLNSITTDLTDGLGLAGETEGSSTGEQTKVGDGYTQAWSNAVVVNNARAMFVVDYETYCLEDAGADTGHVRISLATTTGGTANADGVTFLGGEFSDSGTMQTLDTAVNFITEDAYQQHRAVIQGFGLTAGTTYYVNIDIEGDSDNGDNATTYIRNMYVKVNG